MFFQLWRIHDRVPSPHVLAGRHASNIFCIDFAPDGSKIYSGGNDEVVILRDVTYSSKAKPTAVFEHCDPVYGISVCPETGHVFATACSDGTVRMFDSRLEYDRDRTESMVLARQTSGGAPFHSVQFNPADPRFLVTSNNKGGVALWDARLPRRTLLRYGAPGESAMSARFNSAGTKILGLRKKLPPVLYDVASPAKVAEFDAAGYYNSCTMKTCTFAGADDEYVVSGSDNFGIYVWPVGDLESRDGDGYKVVKRASMVLRGHRSIVNQVRFNRPLGLLASSGVEKMVKLWGRLESQDEEDDANGGDSANSSGQGRDEGQRREAFRREEYIRLVAESNHEYLSECTEENRGMLAFFDSLLQREADSGSSSSSSDSETVRRAARKRRPLNFDHWSEVQTATDDSDSEADNKEKVKPPNRRPDNSSGDDSESGEFPSPARGRRASKLMVSSLIQKLREGMKYRRLREPPLKPREIRRRQRRASRLLSTSSTQFSSFEDLFREAIANYAYDSDSSTHLSDLDDLPTASTSTSMPLPRPLVSKQEIEESARMRSEILAALTSSESTAGSASPSEPDKEGVRKSSDKSGTAASAANGGDEASESVTFKNSGRWKGARRNYRSRNRRGDEQRSSSEGEAD